MELNVVKRDGSRVRFDIEKIIRAMEKSFASTGSVPDRSVMELLALRVSADFAKKVRGQEISVEDIQDSAETILALAGYSEASKAYILYRKQRENIRQLESISREYAMQVQSYLDRPDGEQDLETGSKFSLGGLILSNSGAVTTHYWIQTVYDKEIVEAHEQGWMHIHNLDMLSGASAGWDIRPLIAKGFGLSGRLKSRAPRHLSSLAAQLVNFVGVLQNEWSSAQSIAHFDTLLAPFVKADRLSDDEIRSALETFVFGVGTPSRWGSRPPFSNVVFDWTIPEDWKDKRPEMARKTDFTFGECEEEMKRIQTQFFSILAEGDDAGRGFPFPIPTIRLDNWKREADQRNQNLFDCVVKYGSPYFARNGSPMEGYYSYEAGKGSIGAVTINLPRIAKASKNQEEYEAKVEEITRLAIRSLQTKRRVLDGLMENGLFPYSREYMGGFENCTGTIGLVGMSEACRNACWIDSDLAAGAGREFARKTVGQLRELTGQSGMNLMATPAEGASQRLAQLDRKEWKDIVTAGTDACPYYSNSTMLPAGFTDDLFQAVKIQEDLQYAFTGGSAFSIPASRKLKASEAALLTEVLKEQTSIPVFMFSPTYSICEDHGYIYGDHKECPECQKKCERWIRVAGYYRLMEEVNAGKLQEYHDRKPYKL